MRRKLVLIVGLTITTIPVVSSAEVATYQYDVLGRLTQSFKQGGPGDGVLTTITNDPADNRSNYTVQNVTRILHPGDKVYSSDNAFYLTLKANGELAIIKASTSAELWNSGSATLATDHASFQSDGNLVLFDGSGASLWNSASAGHPGSQLTMQTDGNLVIKDQNGTTTVWQSNTGPVDVSNPSTWTITKDAAAAGTLSGRTFTAREDDGNGWVELHIPFTAVANLQYRLSFDTSGDGTRAVLPEGSGATIKDANAAGHIELVWTATSSGPQTAGVWCDATATRTISNVVLERIN